MTDPLKKFGPIWGASGVQGFFGEGYPYHQFFRLLGLSFDGLTFVSKTSTINSNIGNMPLKEDGITPRELLPKCIYVSPRSWWHGSALNAVALSGPGFGALIEKREWQQKTAPFFISIMTSSSANSAVDRCIEMWRFYERIEEIIRMHSHLQKILGLQINYSCPNTGHDMRALLKQLVEEVKDHLNIFRTLGIPLVPKINILLPVEEVIEIGNDPNCAGLTLSNTIPWGDLPRLEINRREIFGERYQKVSPLTLRGFAQPGGYSGRGLLPHVAQYIENLRFNGFTKHINAGGGILHPRDIQYLHDYGASSFSLGSVTFLRPLQTGPIIDRAYAVKGILRDKGPERFHM